MTQLTSSSDAHAPPGGRAGVIAARSGLDVDAALRRLRGIGHSPDRRGVGGVHRRPPGTGLLSSGRWRVSAHLAITPGPVQRGRATPRAERRRRPSASRPPLGPGTARARPVPDGGCDRRRRRPRAAAGGDDLVHTSSRYLECGGNYDHSAAALHIHRSTLRYRLGRIRDPTGFDLRDVDTRFDLQAARVHGDSSPWSHCPPDGRGSRPNREQGRCVGAGARAPQPLRARRARSHTPHGRVRSPDQPLRRSGSRSPACSVRGSGCGMPSGSCIPRSAVSTA
ncbi:PucR family transcriptional regulator [Nocardia abscessus]|uniref:PucR family transcriptional regulator n=1 Tax=Nocardia abscessus TaxID=120957 RepID=UPI003CC8043F